MEAMTKRYGYDPCPQCGREKKKSAELCRTCASKRPRRRWSTGKRAGRLQAQTAFPLPETCERCEVAPAVERHHRDSDVFNNVPENMMFVCRRCHMEPDGRVNPPLAEIVPMEEYVMGLVA